MCTKIESSNKNGRLPVGFESIDPLKCKSVFPANGGYFASWSFSSTLCLKGRDLFAVTCRFHGSGAAER